MTCISKNLQEVSKAVETAERETEKDSREKKETDRDLKVEPPLRFLKGKASLYWRARR